MLFRSGEEGSGPRRWRGDSNYHIDEDGRAFLTMTTLASTVCLEFGVKNGFGMDDTNLVLTLLIPSKFESWLVEVCVPNLRGSKLS